MEMMPNQSTGIQKGTYSDWIQTAAEPNGFFNLDEDSSSPE